MGCNGLLVDFCEECAAFDETNFGVGMLKIYLLERGTTSLSRILLERLKGVLGGMGFNLGTSFLVQGKVVWKFL